MRTLPQRPVLSPARWTTTRWTHAAWSALTVAGSVGLLFVLAHYALQVRGGQDLDQRAMQSVDVNAGSTRTVLDVLGYISIATTAVALAACVLLALLRRRYEVAAGAVVIVVGANLTTQFLKKQYFGRPDYGHLTLNSLPSGHTTVVVSIVLAALLAAPFAPRLLIATLGTGAVTLTAAATVVAGWHRPADILAALLVSLAWGALVALVLGLRRPGPRPRASILNLGLSSLGAAAAVGFLVAIGVRPEGGLDSFAAGVAVLALLGVACTFTIAVFSRLSALPSW